MKKNILAIVILAATLVNVTLTGMILFSFVPYVNRANNLITEIGKAIELDLNGGNNRKEEEVAIADQETYTVMESANVNLKIGSDGKTRYAQVSTFLTLNKKHEDYATLKPILESQIERVKTIIINEVSSYSFEELSDSNVKTQLNRNVLEKLQDLFDSTFIYAVDIRALIA